MTREEVREKELQRMKRDKMIGEVFNMKRNDEEQDLHHLKDHCTVAHNETNGKWLPVVDVPISKCEKIEFNKKNVKSEVHFDANSSGSNNFANARGSDLNQLQQDETVYGVNSLMYFFKDQFMDKSINKNCVGWKPTG